VKFDKLLSVMKHCIFKRH